jgi:NADPH:quinone reductase-like Zn-dependent oxidoreductase
MGRPLGLKLFDTDEPPRLHLEREAVLHPKIDPIIHLRVDKGSLDALCHEAIVTVRESAALPLVTITAWKGLVDRARVHAGAGGVGSAAVQIALAHGAKVFATVSDDKRSIVDAVGATAIDRRAAVDDYVAEHTGGEGFDIVYDTLGGAVTDGSFASVKRYAGHVVSCLGWGSHSLAPLSFRAATYSGVFTLLPLLADEQFSREDIARAFDAVAKGSKGKVVLEL